MTIKTTLNKALDNVHIDQTFEYAQELFNQLEQISNDGIGITRPSYSDIETQALQMLKNFAQNHGLVVQIDPAQNYIFSLEEIAEDQDYTLIGSHIDSVPEGGNYDGAAGIVSGVLCLVKAER